MTNHDHAASERLTKEEAKALIKAIEEVEQEEAARIQQQPNDSSEVAKQDRDRQTGEAA